MRLGDVATFINGYAFKPSDYSEHGLPIIRIQDLTGNSYQTNMFDGNLDYKYLVRNGDILVSWSASIDAYVWQGSDAWLNQHIFKVVFDKVEVSKSFFFHQMRFILKESGRYAHGATMRHLTKKTFEAFEFLLPSAEVQLQQTTAIDSVDRLIRKACNCLQLLDNLVKSRFVEMFGDVESKEPDQLVELRTLLRMPASNGFFAKRKDYVEDGNVGILGVVNVVNRMYSGIDDLPRTNASSSEIDRYSLSYGDMLFCRSSLVLEGIGKASIVPPNVGENTLFECHVIRLPLDTNMCVPEFLQVQSTMPAFRKQMMAKAKTATMTTIDQKSILSAKVFLPPIELQKAYLAFIKQVDKSRFAVQQSIEQLELLKAKLMQEYFG